MAPSHAYLVAYQRSGPGKAFSSPSLHAAYPSANKQLTLLESAEKSKDAAESLADLKAQIAQSKKLATGHKYVRAGRGERR